jgi:hypothetical protein
VNRRGIAALSAKAGDVRVKVPPPAAVVAAGAPEPVADSEVAAAVAAPDPPPEPHAAVTAATNRAATANHLGDPRGIGTGRFATDPAGRKRGRAAET